MEVPLSVPLRLDTAATTATALQSRLHLKIGITPPRQRKRPNDNTWFCFITFGRGISIALACWAAGGVLRATRSPGCRRTRRRPELAVSTFGRVDSLVTHTPWTIMPTSRSGCFCSPDHLVQGTVKFCCRDEGGDTTLGLLNILLLPTWSSRRAWCRRCVCVGGCGWLWLSSLQRRSDIRECRGLFFFGGLRVIIVDSAVGPP